MLNGASPNPKSSDSRGNPFPAIAFLFFTKLEFNAEKSRNGDTLGPVELNVWLEQGNQGDQGDQGEQGDPGECCDQHNKGDIPIPLIDSAW